MKIPTALIILDGFAFAPATAANAIAAAETPVLDALFRDCPTAKLQTSGEAVGLPAGTMGNSEVGHTNIGAGRVVYQSLLRISRAVEDGSFFENQAYIRAIDGAVAAHKAVHLMILFSEAGVHSHLDHLRAAMRLCKQRGADRVYVHAFMDGRDCAPTSGAGFLAAVLEDCAKTGAVLADAVGRFWIMDRDKRWERLERGYDLLTGQGDWAVSDDPVAAAQASYAAGVTDEFMEPVIFDPAGRIRDGDAVLHLNFRPDRARELTKAFADPNFDGFRRKTWPRTRYVCTTEYEAGIPNVTIAFPPSVPEMTLGEYFSKLNMTQLRIAETEKYAHVTFFFNGGREAEFPGEDRVLIPSPRDFATYDLVPEMSAEKVADELCARIRSGKYDAIVANFANCDMVGHTGNLPATVQAVEVVDRCLGRVLEALADMGGTALVTADHGNADRMAEPDGSPCTSHTTNPVPFCIQGADVKLRDGSLCDIAPTMLELMGLHQPPEMTGQSLICR